MRGNSGFLRHITLCTLSLVLVLLSMVSCGPVRPRRMMREIYSNTEIHNETQSTETCNYNGKEVQSSSVVCEQKPGCLAIQTHGACCPEYQCDCKRDGKIFENGGKIVDPENPCRVCVCRGGEFSCNSVTCYNRNDCKPKFIPGICCPEYDNCPPLEHVKLFSKEAESAEDKFSLKSTTTKSTKISSEEILVSTTETDVKVPDNPLGIKIKEITKTGEIRITDDRPKIYKPPKFSGEVTSTIRPVTTEKVKPNNSEHSSTTPSSFGHSSTTHSSELIEEDDEDKETSDKLEPTLDANIEDQNELEHDYGNTRGDSLGGNKNIRQVDNATIDLKKIEPTSAANEETSAGIESDSPSSTSYNPSSTPEPQESGKHDSVVLVVDPSGQTKSIIVVDTDGLQKVEDPIEEQDDGKSTRKNSVEKVFIVHATTDPTEKLRSSVESTSITSTSDNLLNELSSTATPKFSSEIQNDHTIFETKYYDLITNGPFETASKDVFSEVSSTRGPLSSEELNQMAISSSEVPRSSEENDLENLQSAFIILDTATDQSSAASQKTYELEEDLIGYTEASEQHMVSFDTKFYGSSEQIEGSSSPYDYPMLFGKSTSSEFGSSSVGLPSSTASTADVVDTEDEVENNFENPEFPVIPDDVSIHGIMQENDHDIKTQPTEKNLLFSTFQPKVLLDVLPLGSKKSQNKTESLESKEFSKEKIGSTITSSSRSSEISSTQYTTDSFEGSAETNLGNSSKEMNQKDQSSSFSEEIISEETNLADRPISTENQQHRLVEETPPNYFMQMARDFLRYQNKILST